MLWNLRTANDDLIPLKEKSKTSLVTLSSYTPRNEEDYVYIMSAGVSKEFYTVNGMNLLI